MNFTQTLINNKSLIEEMLASGKSATEIGKHFGCSYQPILRFCRKYNLKHKKRSNIYGNKNKYIKQVMNMYNKHGNMSKIAKELGIDRNTITKWIKDEGIDVSFRRKTKPGKTLLKDRKDEIIDLHNQGWSRSKIAKHFNYATTNVCKFLNENNYKRLKEKYEVNEEFFKVIDTQEKAYVLGFLYADGNVNQAQKGMVVNLQEGDSDILEKIKLAIGYNGPIRFVEKNKDTGDRCVRKDQKALGVYRKSFCQHLVDKGCMPAKSKILQYPTKDIVPDHLIWHFIRGVFDGDGGLSTCGNTASFCGWTDFINGLSDFLFSKGIYHRKYDKFNEDGELSSANIFISREIDKIRFFKFLYRDSSIHLDRKYNLAIQLGFYKPETAQS